MQLQQIIKLTGWAMALTVLPLIASCQWMHEDYEDEALRIANSYINLTFSVSSGNAPFITRSPEGGETGDGLEDGFERENGVDDVTLIFYRASSGVNAPDDTPIDYVAHYQVTLESRQSQGRNIMPEAIYTTGDQPLVSTDLEVGSIYHLLVVANVDLTADITTANTLGDVRKKTIAFADIYTGTGKGTDAKKFIMTSESDAAIDLLNTVPGPTTEHNLVYKFTDIRIERMAARIDFCTSKATYDDERGGYCYPVGKTSDIFVVTSVTPFNLYNESEYLVKRLQNAWTGDIATSYLTDESKTNFVVDPKTGTKTGIPSPAIYTSTIETVASGNTEYRKALAGATTFIDENGFKNITVAYPMENTLMPSSVLFYYATGLAIEGYYYTNGTGDGERMVYYTYLRHQGENPTAPYDATEYDKLDKTAVGKEGLAMNFGVVRNNIYRISIDDISEKTTTTDNPKVTLKIKVKMWDKFEHEEIVM